MVYLDVLTDCLMTRHWKYSQACHMFADEENELHAMADRIGLKRSYFQKHKLLPHYDLTPNKRREAILSGAQSVDMKFVVKYMQRRRKNAALR